MGALTVIRRSSSYLWLHWREVDLVDGGGHRDGAY
jgi:hypothetical protein